MIVKMRDWSFIATVGAILAILLLNTGGEKARKVPSDEKHRPPLDAVARGKAGEEVEKTCPSCHNTHGIPLPKDHPVPHLS